MRILLLGLSAALLAGCNMLPAGNNSSGGNVSAGNAAAPAPGGNALAPGGNMMLPGGESDAGGNSAAAGPRGGGESRAEMMEECTSGAPGNVAEGTDVNRLCSCAVDRVMQGQPQRQSILQCAQEQGVELTGAGVR